MHVSSDSIVIGMLCTVRVFHTIHIWYIPYAYGTYRMRCFSVPYTYGCIVHVYVSHSTKLSRGTGGYIPKPYYPKASPKQLCPLQIAFIIRYILLRL